MSSFRNDKPPIIGAALAFGLIALAGVMAAYSAVEDFASARASGSWMQVEGVVLSPSKPDELRYAYFVDGKSYQGSRLAFTTRGYIGSPPDRSPGARVRVFVNPADARGSVLVHGGSGRRFAAWLLLSGVGVFVGLAGLTRAMMALDFPEFDFRLRAGESTQDGGAKPADHL